MKKNTVAIVADWSSVFGFGNIGPYAALPVMEGKAIFSKNLLILTFFLSACAFRIPKR
jgi:malic enzyme